MCQDHSYKSREEAASSNSEASNVEADLQFRLSQIETELRQLRGHKVEFADINQATGSDSDDFKKTAQRDAWQFVWMLIAVALSLIVVLYVASFSYFGKQPSGWGSMADFVAGTFGVAAGIAGAYVVIRLANQALTTSLQQNALVKSQNRLAESQKKRDDYAILNEEITSSLDKIFTLARRLHLFFVTVRASELTASLASQKDDAIRAEILELLHIHLDLKLESLNDLEENDLKQAMQVREVKAKFDELRAIGINGRFPFMLDPEVVEHKILPSLESTIEALGDVVYDTRASALLIECARESESRFQVVLEAIQKQDPTFSGWRPRDPISLLDALLLKVSSYKVQMKVDPNGVLDIASYLLTVQQVRTESEVGMGKDWLNYFQSEAVFRFGLLMWHRPSEDGTKTLNAGGALLLSLIDILPETAELKAAVKQLYGGFTDNKELLDTLPAIIGVDQRESLVSSELANSVRNIDELLDAFILDNEKLSIVLQKVQEDLA